MLFIMMTTFQKEGVITTELLWLKLIKQAGQPIQDLYDSLIHDSSMSNYYCVLKALYASHASKELVAALIREELFCDGDLTLAIEELKSIQEYGSREEFRFSKAWGVYDGIETYSLWFKWTKRVFNCLDQINLMDSHAEVPNFFSKCGNVSLNYLGRYIPDTLNTTETQETHRNRKMAPTEWETNQNSVKSDIKREVYDQENIWTINNLEKLFLVYIKRCVSKDDENVLLKINFIELLFSKYQKVADCGVTSSWTPVNNQLLDPMYNIRDGIDKHHSPSYAEIERTRISFHNKAHRFYQGVNTFEAHESLSQQPQVKSEPKPTPSYLKKGLIGALIGGLVILAVAVVLVMIVFGGPASIGMGMGGLISIGLGSLLVGTGVGAGVGVAKANAETATGSTLEMARIFGKDCLHPVVALPATLAQVPYQPLMQSAPVVERDDQLRLGH